MRYSNVYVHALSELSIVNVVTSLSLAIQYANFLFGLQVARQLSSLSNYSIP